MVRSQWPEVSRHLETAKIAALATEEALIWNYYTQEHRVNLHELYETIEPSLTRRLVAISLHAPPNQLLFFNRSRPNEMCQNRKLTDQILKDHNKRGTHDHFEMWPLLMRPSHMNIILAWVNLMFRPGQYSISISRPRGLRDAKVRELSYSTYLHRHRHENRNRSTSSMSLKIPLKCDPQTSWRARDNACRVIIDEASASVHSTREEEEPCIVWLWNSKDTGAATEL